MNIFKRPFHKKIEILCREAFDLLVEHDMLASYHKQMAEHLRHKIQYLQTEGWVTPSTKLQEEETKE